MNTRSTPATSAEEEGPAGACPGSGTTGWRGGGRGSGWRALCEAASVVESGAGAEEACGGLGAPAGRQGANARAPRLLLVPQPSAPDTAPVPTVAGTTQARRAAVPPPPQAAAARHACRPRACGGVRRGVVVLRRVAAGRHVCRPKACCRPAALPRCCCCCCCCSLGGRSPHEALPQLLPRRRRRGPTAAGLQAHARRGGRCQYPLQGAREARARVYRLRQQRGGVVKVWAARPGGAGQQGG